MANGRNLYVIYDITFCGCVLVFICCAVMPSVHLVTYVFRILVNKRATRLWTANSDFDVVSGDYSDDGFVNADNVIYKVTNIILKCLYQVQSWK